MKENKQWRAFADVDVVTKCMHRRQRSDGGGLPGLKFGLALIGFGRCVWAGEGRRDEGRQLFYAIKFRHFSFATSIGKMPA